MSKSLKILFSRTSTLYAAAIRAYPPNGPYSHCGIFIENEVIESLARKNGVVKSSLYDFMERSSRVVLMEIPAPSVEYANKIAIDQVGKLKYDWLYVLAIPFRIRGLHSPNSVACTEHCAKYIEQAGLDIFSPNMHGLTPNHLFQLIYAAGGRVTAEFK